jgi:HEPN domain-containing protein
MARDPEEWFRQADYDIETAEYMFKGGRYFYSVFMGHLAIEKALKGLYQKRLRATPPKVHNLVYLLNKIELRPPELQAKFLIKLNEASVPTRYPETLELLKRDYTQGVVEDILFKSKEVLEWIKNQR